MDGQSDCCGRFCWIFFGVKRRGGKNWEKKWVEKTLVICCCLFLGGWKFLSSLNKNMHDNETYICIGGGFIFFIFKPLLEEMNGWLNHQLDSVFFSRGILF